MRVCVEFSGVQTPNCVRQTVFDAVALDYEKVTVIVDATAAASPEIQMGENSFIPSTSTLFVDATFSCWIWRHQCLLDEKNWNCLIYLQSLCCPPQRSLKAFTIYVLPSKRQRHEEHWGGDTNLGRLESSGLIVLHAQHQRDIDQTRRVVLQKRRIWLVLLRYECV